MRNISVDPFQIWDENMYVRLRDSARRGGEPSRVTIAEWKEALQNKWTDKQRSEDFDDLVLIKSLNVTYLTGKGNNHLPGDTTETLEKLSDKKVHNQKVHNLTIADRSFLLFLSPYGSFGNNHPAGTHGGHKDRKTTVRD